jgi:hypothetical protein
LVQGRETHDWLNLGSFSQPHSVPRRPKTRKHDASVSRSHHCYGTRHGCRVECTPDGESPSFTCQSGAVTLIARSAFDDMRLCTWETHSCPTVPTSPLDKAWTLRKTRAPPPIRAIKHLHQLPTPRDPPAVCSCNGTAESSERSSLDLAQNLLALPMHVCGRAQPTATC